MNSRFRTQLESNGLVQIGGRAGSRPSSADSAFDSPSLDDKLERLGAWIASTGSAIVAYSGGVDSSLVLRASRNALGDRVLAVIGRSDSYALRELELALAQAQAMGARVEVVATGELSDPNFRSNPANRCYHCKSELYRKLEHVRLREGFAAVLDGTIADDLGDWRPGRRAAFESGVRSPLAELGFTKRDVREAARRFGLESHDKPASPCLASRIPYGQEITARKLASIEAGEELLRSLGLGDLRLRHHGDLARIEVPVEDLPRLVEPGARSRLVEGLRGLGFRHVTLDLLGFRSGSLNEALGEPPPNS